MARQSDELRKMGKRIEVAKGGKCRWKCICLAGAFAFAFVSAHDVFAHSEPFTLRTKDDMRLWQTVFDRTSPLSWPWEDGAEFATLSFSNHVTKAVSLFSVARADDEARGFFPHPAEPTGDSLFGVTLVQKMSCNGDGGPDDGIEISRETATLAYVTCAGGGPITVRVKDTRDWERVRQPRIVAFDPAWHGETGESGYRAQRPTKNGFVISIR